MATTSTVIADNGKAIETDRPPVMPTVPMVTAEEFDAILKALACREDGKLTLVVSERDIQSARHPPYSQEISTFLPTKDLDPDDPDPDWESQSHRLYPEGTRVRYLRIARTSAHEGDTERRLDFVAKDPEGSFVCRNIGGGRVVAGFGTRLEHVAGTTVDEPPVELAVMRADRFFGERSAS